jgi:hypothetical protein
MAVCSKECSLWSVESEPTCGMICALLAFLPPLSKKSASGIILSALCLCGCPSI